MCQLCRGSPKPHKTQPQGAPSNRGTMWPGEGLSPVQGHPEDPRQSPKPNSGPPEGQLAREEAGEGRGFVGLSLKLPSRAAGPAGGRCSRLLPATLPPRPGAHPQGGWQAGWDGPQMVPVQPQVEQAV